MVQTILLVSLWWNTGSCAWILGIEDLPSVQDSGSQPVDGRIPIDGGAPVDGSTPVDGPPLVGIDATPSPLRRKQITIPADKVEAPASPGFLADFPVLFAVQDPQIAARAGTDESNIYFVDADGATRLEHEIEKWSPDTGELVAWVKLPRVSATADTVFYVHYGAPAPGAPAAPAQVWSNGFAAVWHLAEPPGPGTQGGITDSTTGNDGTAHASMQANDLVRGQIGDAIDFDGVDDEITFQNPITGPGPHTISVWVNQRATTSFDALVVLGQGDPNRARMFYSVYFEDEAAFGFYANDGTTNTNIIGDGWTLMHWTYENRDNVVYIDGTSLGTVRVGNGVDTQGSDGRLGNVTSGDFGSNMNLNGQLDEVRIATVVRPAEWVRTEFNNQSDPASFYTVGPETAP
jgi:MSHA biogenesis protein MshQ